MVRARSIEAFLAAPVSRYLRGKHYLFWCHGPRLLGSAHWGRTPEPELREVLLLLEVIGSPALSAPFDVVTDARNVATAPAITGFELALRHTRERVNAMGQLVRRHAILHSGGLSGCLVAGFLPLIGVRHSFQLFTDPGEAFAWLDNPDADAARSVVEKLTHEAHALPALVGAVRDYLSRRDAVFRVDAAARALGLSARSLQRGLLEHGTSFRDELGRARVHAAVPRVLETEEKLAAIARGLGYSSLSAFTRAYRRETGETPSQARARRRVPGAN
jgi:AraC-like DNA-binding protein